MLKPLGFRVLIKPDAQPESSESGLIQLPQDRDHVACSGTVVAVGNGAELSHRARVEAFQHFALVCERENDLHTARAVRDYADNLRMPTPSVQVGDRVVIPVEAGMNVSEDGVQYVIVNEDDLVIIVDESEAAA